MAHIDMDEIRKLVAIKHNVLLGKDDPILVTVTLNELVLDHYLELAGKRGEEAERLFAVALAQHMEQAKGTAGKVITDAADYVSVQVRQAVNAALLDAANQLRQQVTEAQAATRQVAASAESSRTAKTVTIIAAVAAGLCAVVAVAAAATVFLST